MSFTALDAALESRLRTAELTYPEVGATGGELPPGYRHLRRRVSLGTGRAVFDAAADALFGWHMHAGSVTRVAATAPRAGPDVIVVLTVGAGPLRVHAPCRVVWMADEPRRQGFAYGTLPGHPERGEESFVVEFGEDDAVSFAITAFSRPASLLARMAGPIGGLAQRGMTNRYLRTLAGLAGAA
jgi:uncharacterized protein (UPF0548 family)